MRYGWTTYAVIFLVVVYSGQLFAEEQTTLEAPGAETEALNALAKFKPTVIRDRLIPGERVVEIAFHEDLDLAQKVGDVEYKHLACLKELRKLDLMSTKVTTSGLKELAGLTKLRELSLF